MISVELRPPRAELEAAAGIDAWIDLYHSIRTLARHDVLTPRLLDGEPLIGMLPGHATTPRLADAFETAGARLNLVAQCEFFVISINLAADGVGVALSDPISAAAAAPPTLCVRPFAPVLPYEVAMLKPPRAGLSRLAAAFANEAHAHLRTFAWENGT